MDCGKIISGFVGGSCGEVPTGGTGTRVVLINYADIDKENSTVSEEDATISEIALKTSKTGYLFETLEKANEGSITFTRGTYVDTFTHSLTLRLFADGKDAKKWVQSLVGARVVAIVEKLAGGDGKWEVYGWKAGLKLSELTYSTTYTDNVAFAPVLSSEDTSPESALPYTFYKTSEAETEAAVLALVQAAES